MDAKISGKWTLNHHFSITAIQLGTKLFHKTQVATLHLLLSVGYSYTFGNSIQQISFAIRAQW